MYIINSNETISNSFQINKQLQRKITFYNSTCLKTNFWQIQEDRVVSAGY